MSKYSLADNISVFNIKAVYNLFVKEMEAAGYHNIIRNPELTESFNGEHYKWDSSLDLLTFDSTNVFTGEVTYTLDDQEFISQDVTEFMQLGMKYAGTFRLKCTKQLRIVLKGGANDISCPDLGQTSKAEIIIDPSSELDFYSFTALVRDTVAGGTKFNDNIVLSFISDATDNQVTFGGIYLTQGAINFTALPKTAKILDCIRYNTDDRDWEFTNNGIAWKKLAGLSDIGEVDLSEYLKASDIIGGNGITVNYIYDGTAITKVEIIADTTGSVGFGDWTKEDVNYQSMLEHSDFKYVVFDKFVEDNLVASGTVQHIAADNGYYSLIGGSSVTTPNILPAFGTSGPFYSFFPSFDGENITAEYSINNGVSWVEFDSDELILYGAGFTSLKFKFTANSATNIYSYGVLFGDEVTASGAIGFRERYTVPSFLTSGSTVDIPNGRLYHVDGKSLHVMINREVMIKDIDYVEVGSGFSNQVQLLIDVTSSSEIIFEEYYGQYDFSADNKILIEDIAAEIDAINIIDSTQDNRITVLENKSSFVPNLDFGVHFRSSNTLDGGTDNPLSLVENTWVTFKPTIVPANAKAIVVNFWAHEANIWACHPSDTFVGTIPNINDANYDMFRCLVLQVPINRTLSNQKTINCNNGQISVYIQPTDPPSYLLKANIIGWYI